MKTTLSYSYKYFVYVAPGNIRYFTDLHAAEQFAQENDARVQEMD